mgnify:CR=1 FL=1
MPDQKIDNLLNLAMEATPQERAKSENLNVGYDSTAKLWDVIVKYSGPESGLGGDGIQVVPLLGGYAVVTLPETEIDAYSDRQQVEFIEKPKRLYFETLQAREASCILPVQAGANGLTGEGILVGVVDSGVDYFHPDFRNEDGSSRILRLWDQSLDGKPPRGYVTGTEYAKEEIDKALALGETEGRRLVALHIEEAPVARPLIPSRDFSGHGTAVLGIAAGNGRASGGVNRGVAYKSDLLVVKMGNARENSFPRTTELMEGIDYLIRQAVKMGRPIAINISFGNNYGSHQGDSLLETYLSNAANVGRSVICVGSGNNGNDRIHTAGQLRQGQTETVEMSIGTYETTLNLQLWKAYADEIEISIETPSGERLPTLSEKIGTQRYRAGETDLLIYYGKPGPFQVTQEIYFDFIPVETYLTSGIWKIHLHGRRIREGNYNLWLPGGNVLNPVTGFYRPIAAETLTIPSTAAKVITVGAYDSRLNAYADFSGRGGSNLSFPKPDLVAPGVNITAPTPGGAYTTVTGTSFSTPFVTGSAALLMEWGIIQRNDPFLWGEKVKAYLRRGAQPLPGFNEYPNEAVGWGRLCLTSSLL